MRSLLAGLALCAVMMLALAATAAAEQRNGTATYETIYPCTKCHVALKLSGNVKESAFHNITLKGDAHSGLFCSNCHVPPYMIELRGGVLVYIPGYHDRSLVMETNKLCSTCHPREYRDYINLVHGNKTFVCSNGSTIVVKGYKGVAYLFHLCPNGYRNLTTVPARACVECHDPHTPSYRPLPPLPQPSERPPPPPEDSVTIANVAVLAASMILVGYAFASKGGGIGGRGQEG